tara:strand:- start:100 stop:225 length:126 start_codon:yes stop_codon:yes gene_type:complete
VFSFYPPMLVNLKHKPTLMGYYRKSRKKFKLSTTPGCGVVD